MPEPTRPAVVTGASRGFGRAIATALVAAGMPVVGLARDAGRLRTQQEELGEGFVPVVGDAVDEELARWVLAEHDPRLLVLNAGAAPTMAPVHEHTWESFSAPWEVDARQAFTWAKVALTAPLPPGSHVVAVSSGAALRGSPLSGGYAGAKAAVRFVARYAAEESDRAGLGIGFTTLLPQLTAATDLGAAAAAAYAARAGGVTSGAPGLTPEQVGKAVVGIALDDAAPGAEYLLTAAGPQPLEAP
ncbi:SDR family oxidoreductase [Actinomycetospora sp. TBRC 11914]|uniref:SDR family oxidoreductase n=1 Tax=Actinomycetospora sp. TBRC 11914 TaxID=2729387 RepID=UPI00145DE7A5|nr:SDR family oxidoreductase [Actinomycetospora sp. TBRC 11914]NMO92221.1 SDR family oxidoreductase [Actinomycetospora sp. TBRC 11914]